MKHTPLGRPFLTVWSRQALSAMGWLGPIFGTGDGRGAAVVLAAAGLALVATGASLHCSPARRTLYAGDLLKLSHASSG